MSLGTAGRDLTTVDTGTECELAFCTGPAALSECVLCSEGEGLGKVSISLPLSPLDS